MFLYIFFYNAKKVLGIVEQCLYCLHAVFKFVHERFALFSGLGLYTAHTGCYAALRYYLEHAYAACRLGVDTTAELYARTEVYNAYLVAVFLAEQGYRTHLLGFLYRHVAVLVERYVLAYHVVHHDFHLAYFLVGHFLEVREVEAQRVRRYV